ncbi:hypothetical protein HG536_0F00780 [Torulaspora globosa]|uniref:Sodium/calcium exchanger membrane region domain-containing protein n=1 Tax=Torulaspora globosa TaxID=48254 RepID=A0A7G3ZJR7_9SACH|nr:uncharacterized protein HG536_0F00780 [Torulaspora globosa]QLL33753.1 hypothetical protein HG536_0F00780 [Torulaspora globosa]
MMEWAIKLSHPHLLYSETSLSLGFALASTFHVVLCFVLLGLAASEYLCPNVAKLAEITGHGNGPLMAVLLAWCNCSPDLFSNFMSWTSTSTPSSGVALSVGEVLGACGIILCVVEGSIFVIMSSAQLELSSGQKLNVLRDLAFTLVAILLLLYLSIRQKISALDCLVMLTIYVSYLFAKFKWRIGEGQETEFDNGDENYRGQELDGANLPSRIKPSLISAMEINDILSMLQSSRTASTRSQGELMTLNAEDNAFTVLEEARPSTEPLRQSDVSEFQELPRSSPAAFGPYFDNPEQQDGEMLIEIPLVKRRGGIQKWKRGFFKLFVPHLLNFRQKSAIDAILSVCTAPFATLLRLACPQTTNILEVDNNTGKYTATNVDITLLFVQSIFCPVFSFAVISCIMAKGMSFMLWILSFLAAACLFFLALIFYRSLLSFNRFSLLQPSWNVASDSDELGDERRMVEKLGNVISMIFLSFGIVNATLCISLIANSLIELLEIYQRITKASQAILGLTLFAWGNSVGDLISNIAMCRLYRKKPQAVGQNVGKIATKFFLISCTSCIGGVLLNSMGGIGLSGLISMTFVHQSSNKWLFLRAVDLHDGEHSHNYKLIISCAAIILQTILLAIFFGASGRLHNYVRGKMRIAGLCMCSIWAIATTCNVLLEILQ